MGSYNRVIYELLIRKNFIFLADQIKKRVIHHSDVVKTLIANHDYEKAVKVLENTGRTNTFEYAYCLQSLGNQQQATEVMKEWLFNSTGISVEEVIGAINQRLYKDTEPCRLEYVYFGGITNFGFITHSDGQKITSVTKITDIKSANREISFYRQHIGNIRNAEDFIPECLDIYTYKNRLNLITVEYIDQISLGEEHEIDVLKINSYIEAYSLEKFKQNCGSAVKLYAGNEEISHLDKRITIKMMLEKMMNALKSTPDYEMLASDLNIITREILSSRVYLEIDPEVHYSFCHNDFHRKNMFVSNHSVYVIDWNNYRYGLRGWDIAYYWGNYERSFRYIKENYIENLIHTEAGRKEIIWRIFYTYILLYVWVARLHKQSVKTYLKDYFAPAVDYIKKQISLL